MIFTCYRTSKVEFVYSIKHGSIGNNNRVDFYFIGRKNSKSHEIASEI
jgi:hypothetical protein